MATMLWQRKWRQELIMHSRSSLKFILAISWLAFFFTAPALATDEIICDSKSFKVSLAVGSDGYVASVVISNSSRAYFPEILELEDLLENRRHVSIHDRSVDLEINLGMKSANRFKICIKKGEGYVELDGHRESMTCDWKI